MKQESAYLLSDHYLGEKEARRLSLSARIFIDLEFEKLKPYLQDASFIADIGCGTGEIAQAIASSQPSAEVHGFDIDPISLEKSSEKAKNTDNLSIHSWQLGSNETPTGSPFDMMLIRLVLLHLSNPKQLVNAAAKHLKPNASLYLIDVDDRDAVFEPKQPWQNELLDIMQSVQTARGGTRHMGRELAHYLKDAQLTEVHVEKIIYSKQALGLEIYREMALPIYEYYLSVAKDTGASIELIQTALTEFMNNPKTEMQICFWHAAGKVQS